MGSEWFRRFGPAEAAHRSGGPGGVRLFCFPHAGGAASAFMALARELAGSVDVYAAQYPGRQDRLREEPVADIGRLADALTGEVLGHGAGPYAFFGHSMGAVLAYETARRIEERQEPGPVRLFLSGRGAPSATPGRHDRLRTDADILAAVRRLGGTTPKAIEDPEVLDMVMPALRADYRAIGSYAAAPAEPLHIPFTVLIGDSDPVVTVSEAAAWRDISTAPAVTRVFPGGHFYLDQQVGEVARTVTEALAQDIPTGAPGVPAS